MNLVDLVSRQAAQAPGATAVRGPDAALTYGELDVLADRFRRVLSDASVRRGDRVGIYLDKSACTVAVMQAVLRLGAAYVPLDPFSPIRRLRSIASNCDLRALVTTELRAQELLTGDLQHVARVCVDRDSQDRRCSDLSWLPDPLSGGADIADDDLAYILHTSGSTGQPKGVCISHRNALAFIQWAAAEISATDRDRFCSQAPFHFDLSVLDLYVAFHAGASVSLVPDAWTPMAPALVAFIIRERISVWYSVPSVLVAMMEHGGVLDVDPLPLRVILFAGEPFPPKYLRRLGERWAGLRLLNLYGPTETNVCAFHEVRPSDWRDNNPIPIGRACSGDTVWAIKGNGAVAREGEEGELVVSGPSVMLGYWRGQPQSGAPYATGDRVRLLGDGNYVYLGRRDRMVKLRGHRVELAEVETALEQHPNVREAAVIVSGVELETRLIAFVSGVPMASRSLLAIKRHCAERLPPYMIVDDVCFVDALPRTRTGKIDLQALADEALGPKAQVH